MMGHKRVYKPSEKYAVGEIRNHSAPLGECSGDDCDTCAAERVLEKVHGGIHVAQQKEVGVPDKCRRSIARVPKGKTIPNRIKGNSSTASIEQIFDQLKRATQKVREFFAALVYCGGRSANYYLLC